MWTVEHIYRTLAALTLAFMAEMVLVTFTSRVLLLITLIVLVMFYITITTMTAYCTASYTELAALKLYGTLMLYLGLRQVKLCLAKLRFPFHNPLLTQHTVQLPALFLRVRTQRLLDMGSPTGDGKAKDDQHSPKRLLHASVTSTEPSSSETVELS